MSRRHRQKTKTDYSALISKVVARFDLNAIKQGCAAFWQSLPARNRRALQIITPFVLILMVLPLPDPTLPIQETPARIEVLIHPVGLSEQSTQTQADPSNPQPQNNQDHSQWVEYVVKKGDTLAQVFRNNDLPMADLNALVRVEGSDRPLSYIKQGQLIRFKLANNGKLDILQLDKSNVQSVMFFRLSDGTFGRSK